MSSINHKNILSIIKTFPDIYIKHGNTDDIFKKYELDANSIAKEIIEQYIENIDIEMNLLTPAFTTQGGPGCVAIQIIKKHEVLV